VLIYHLFVSSLAVKIILLSIKSIPVSIILVDRVFNGKIPCFSKIDISKSRLFLEETFFFSDRKFSIFFALFEEFAWFHPIDELNLRNHLTVMSALDVLRQIKQLRRSQQTNVRVVEWGNAEFINNVGIENLTRKELRNHLEARDLDTQGTRLELIERLRTSIADEQLHKFAYNETLDTAELIQADIEERGSVYVAGLNDRGQLGLGDIEPRRFFTVIPSMRGIGVVYVRSGADMSYAVTHEHDVYVWGGGGVGRTGINPTVRKRGSAAKEKNWLEPVIVPEMAGEECSAVVLGSSHCMALGRGGDVFVWGDNDSGQLGLGHFTNQITVSINNSFPSVKQIACGANHSVVITQTGQVYNWGHGYNGRLGIGEVERLGVPDREKHFFPVPMSIKTLEPIHQIACGVDYTMAIGDSGVWSWGNGSGGKLGHGDIRDRYEPTLIPKLMGKSVLQIEASAFHSLALVQYPPFLDAGYLYTWGQGYFGQLAQGAISMLYEPKIVEFFVQCHLPLKSIAAGPNHCLAVTKDGELFSWGNNLYGALGRKIDEKDVQFTPLPGHVGGFGALVNRIGRGFPRAITCGRDFSVVATFPYEGPDFMLATKLMEEARIREQEALLAQSRTDYSNAQE
jgi:alpha-tubulin suppressor-like RCC1 family protein